MTADTLVVFCRKPAPGMGKQRLAARLGVERTATLAGLLLATALEDARAWPGQVVLAPASAGDSGWAAGLLARKVTILSQPEGNLGERLAAVDRAARGAGHERIHFIGSDAPVLDEAYYDAAREALGATPVVLGPATDGGVTLMASAVPWPPLADLPWSTGELAQALAARCDAAGLAVRWLPPRYDVDVIGDLPKVARDLAADPRPARRALYQWLTGLGYS